MPDRDAVAPIRDSHVHAFTRVFFETLAKQGQPNETVDTTLNQLAEEQGLDVPSGELGPLRKRWIDAFDRAGVQSAAIFASIPEEADAVIRLCEEETERMVPFAVVNPGADGSIARIKALAKKGYRGLLTFPAMHHFDPADEDLDVVWKAAGSSGLPIIVHTGLLVIPLREKLGLPRLMNWRLAHPLAVAAAANRNPETTFILPHFGGGFFREALMAGAGSPNVMIDTSSSNSWIKTSPTPLDLRTVFDRALGVYGPERILFGTDSSAWPRGYRDDVLDHQLGIVEELGLSETERRQIFGENFARLIT